MAYWSFRGIDTMAWSRDYAQGQQVKSRVPLLCRRLASLHVSHLTYDGPYDDPATYGAPPGWMNWWLQSIRDTGSRVWFRMGWATWQGWFGKPVLTYSTSPAVPYESPGRVWWVVNGQDKISYLAKTYQWILQNPSAFRDGDIFSPISEPQNGYIAPYFPAGASPQFPSLIAFNNFITDITVVCRLAFQTIGKKVTVGFYGCQGRPGDADQLYLSTIRDIGPRAVSADLYYATPADMVLHLRVLHDYYRAPIILGEWGDIWDSTPDQAVQRVNTIYSAVSRLPFVPGVSYFEGVSHRGPVPASNDGLVDPNTLQILPHGQAVGQWFARQTPPWERPVVWAGLATAVGGLWYIHRRRS